ncbi:hypothetical protein HWV62_34495 [Athelia sp. TMB]|nr:hypothetical protein HWV62_34495 [Athelia sp. TMB]
MVNFKALFATIVLSFSLSALGSPVVREEKSFLTHPITKKTGKSITNILAKDTARLAHYNKDAAAAVYSGAVTNEDDTYVAAVTVGTQVFSLIVDTGSSNTWVGAGTKLTGGTSTGKAVTVSYGSGSFSGTEYTDSVWLCSGVTEVPTFLDNLYSQGSISSEVLGVYYTAESGSDDDDTNGELTLGGMQTTTGETEYYWGVAVSAITYGTTSLGSGSAIVDTGTTLIYIPSTAYTKFLTASGGKTDSSTGLAIYKTEPTANFSFTIGGTVLSLTPAEYLIPKAQYTVWGLTGSSYYSWISSGGSSGVDFIIGQKFIENYYTVFDTTNARVGFAAHA